MRDAAGAEEGCERGFSQLVPSWSLANHLFQGNRLLVEVARDTAGPRGKILRLGKLGANML